MVWTSRAAVQHVTVEIDIRTVYTNAQGGLLLEGLMSGAGHRRHDACLPMPVNSYRVWHNASRTSSALHWLPPIRVLSDFSVCISFFVFVLCSFLFFFSLLARRAYSEFLSVASVFVNVVKIYPCTD